MGFSLTFQHWFVYVMVLLPALCYSYPHDIFVKSRATYYDTPDDLGTPSGACGFGQYGRIVDNGKVATVSSRLYKDGIGCGACYQVRCTNPQLCSDNGVNVVVTDNGEDDDNTDFILSPRAFAGMARSRNGTHLFAYGVLDVEYKRISCQYPGHNLQIKVMEHSRNPNYLAIILLYQGGKCEILSIEIWKKDTQQWIRMRRVYGAVFDMPNPPLGAITSRFQVQCGAGVDWVYATNVIPSYWKAGGAYEANIQLE